MSEPERAKWRQIRSEASAEKHRRRNLASGRARQRLVERHRAEYDRVFAEELALLMKEER
jgi:hypothetical protein